MYYLYILHVYSQKDCFLDILAYICDVKTNGMKQSLILN